LEKEGEPIEEPDRARVTFEQPSEVRLAQPPVDVRARLDADRLRNVGRLAEAGGEKGLAKAALPERPVDVIPEPCFRAGDDLSRLEQQADRPREGRPPGRARRRHLP